MALTIYDSPTFLTQKDKYLMGLSLPQLMIVIGVGFTLFLFSLILPFGILIRLLVVLAATGSISVLFFARLSGLTIPAYLLAALLSMKRRPVYEEHPILLLNGGLVWLEARNRKNTRVGRRFFLFGRAKVLSDDMAMQTVASELHAELDSKVVQGTVATEQFVKDGFRALFKGS